MTPETLRAIGETLYGEDWIAKLADKIGVNRRSMQRFASGAKVMPDGVHEDILDVVADRADELQHLKLNTLEGHI